MPIESTVEVNQQRLWTESLGDPEDQPILLICGAGAHAHFWTNSFCQPLIKQGHYVIRYDLRDTGLSHPAQEDYTINDLVGDAAGILDAYQISAAHIIGHSMGGYIGQLMAASYPNRVLSFTSLSAGPAGETDALTQPHTPEEREILHRTWILMLRNRPTQDFEESWEGFKTVWERLNGMVPLNEGMARAYTQEMYTRSRYPVGPHARHMKVMQDLANTLKERKDLFEKIKAPTLIIHGEEDYLVPPGRGGKALKEALPHAQLEMIPKMGHMLFDYDLEKHVTEKMIRFFQVS